MGNPTCDLLVYGMTLQPTKPHWPGQKRERWGERKGKREGGWRERRKQEKRERGRRKREISYFPLSFALKHFIFPCKQALEKCIWLFKVKTVSSSFPASIIMDL